MAQVLIRHYSTDPIYHAVQHNCRRRPLIRGALTDADQWVLKEAEAYRRWALPTLESGPMVTRRGVGRVLRKVWLEEHCKVYTVNEANDRRGGFVLLHGDLQLLHHVDHGRGDWLVRQALSEGAETLNCYAVPHLLDLYHRNGFRTMDIQENHTPGGLPVHYMEII